MRPYLLPILLLAEIALFTAISDVQFGSVADFVDYFRYYLMDLVPQAAPVLILSFGMTVVMLTAGIDLSVGSMVVLVACVMSQFEGDQQFWMTAIPIGIGLAFTLGFVNGSLVAWLDVPPIIATLGTMMFYRGACSIVMGDRENDPFYDVPGYEWFAGTVGTVVVVGILFALGGSWLQWSRWRRELLMLGGNRVAARYAGIPVTKRLLQVYSLMGLLTFPAALCFTAHDGAVNAGSLPGLELKVIVAVVLGGTQVEGGKGSVFGSVIGALLIAVLDEGLRGASGWGDRNLPFEISHLRFVLLGGLLLLGVWLNSHADKSRPLNPASPTATPKPT